MIAARLRVLEGDAQCVPPHLEIVVDDEHLRGAAKMVRLDPAGNNVPEVESSWDEPWRAPWGDELPPRTVDVVHGSGDQATARSIDPMQPSLNPSPVVAPVVAGWSAVDAQTATTDDQRNDQAHDHPGTFWDPGKMAAGSVTAVDATVVQTGTVARTATDADPNRGHAATAGEGSGVVRTCRECAPDAHRGSPGCGGCARTRRRPHGARGSPRRRLSRRARAHRIPPPDAVRTAHRAGAGAATAQRTRRALPLNPPTHVRRSRMLTHAFIVIAANDPRSVPSRRLAPRRSGTGRSCSASASRRTPSPSGST